LPELDEAHVGHDEAGEEAEQGDNRERVDAGGLQL
jgi:hypothetical protein